MTDRRFTVVGIGEALFDVFTDTQRMGGAPLNVAVHANQLAATRSGQAVPVSRVGQDQLGDALIDELKQRGIETAYIQTDPDRPTGRVYVEMDEHNQPHYEIVRDVAWDVIQFDFDLEDLAHNCAGVCFGTLAQRDGQSRNTIFRFLDMAPRPATRLLDVNLRQDAYDPRTLRRSCEAATIVKLNTEELDIVSRQLGSAVGDEDSAGIERARWLIRTYKLEMLVHTRGDQGTQIITADKVFEGKPMVFEPTSDADPVGAGDAAAAAILVGKALRLGPQKLADLANAAGGYVASQPGATPTLPDAVLGMLK